MNLIHTVYTSLIFVPTKKYLSIRLTYKEYLNNEKGTKTIFKQNINK